MLTNTPPHRVKRRSDVQTYGESVSAARRSKNNLTRSSVFRLNVELQVLSVRSSQVMLLDYFLNFVLSYDTDPESVCDLQHEAEDIKTSTPQSGESWI